MTPTWLHDIRPIFSQYDRVKMLFYFDLHAYDDVRQNIAAILLCVQPSEDASLAMAGWSRLPNVHVMPKYATWTSEVRARNVALLERWRDAEFPYGGALPQPSPTDPDLARFLALASTLTGYDVRKQPSLGNWYLARLRERLQVMDARAVPPTRLGSALQRLLDALPAVAPPPPEPSELAAALTDADEITVARMIVELWYTAAFLAQSGPARGNPEDIPGEPPLFGPPPAPGPSSRAFGTPEDNRYVRGLVWDVAQAHPMGFSTETMYWQHEPEASGQFSGSWPFLTDRDEKGVQA